MKKYSEQSSEHNPASEDTTAVTTVHNRTYSDDFVARCKDLAVIGLYPTQIAERLGLYGDERSDFLFDCMNQLHPLHILMQLAHSHGDKDIQAALVTMASGGDTDAMELAMKKRHDDRYLEVRNELFGF